MTQRSKYLAAGLAVTALMGLSGAARAAEGFIVRYNLIGTLAVELFAPIDQEGWVGSIVRSDARTDKVTGPDGGTLTRVLPGGSAAVTSPAPGTIVYQPNTVQVTSSGSLTQYNVLLGYLTPARYGDGRLAFGVNIPYVARKTQTTRVTGPNASALFNGVVNVTNSPAFTNLYQGQLSSLGAADSGEVNGMGDIELQMGWLRRTDTLRVLAGASLVLPTGSYNPASGPDVSQGKFYTLRPAVQAVWFPAPQWSLGGRVTYAVNSRNQDSHVRTGNWIGLEGAAGYRTSLGVVGLQGVHIEQVQDDSGNAWGPSRLRASHAGVFFTTRVEAIDSAVTAQYMRTVESRNARHGRYLQFRLTRAF